MKRVSRLPNNSVLIWSDVNARCEVEVWKSLKRVYEVFKYTYYTRIYSYSIDAYLNFGLYNNYVEKYLL